MEHTMGEKPSKVSIICRREEFNTIYFYLKEKEIDCSHFETIEQCSTSEGLSQCSAMIIDLGLYSDKDISQLHSLSEQHPEIPLILTWDTEKAVYPENIPKIFFCMKKPFSREKLSSVLEKVFSREFHKERRREPRIPVELPVELYCRTKFWIARTTNISLHGMQVAWDSGNIEEILETYGTDSGKMTACRLFLEKSIDFSAEHLNISVTRRYTINQDVEDSPTLMGFEFRDLDADLRTRLQKVVIW